MEIQEELQFKSKSCLLEHSLLLKMVNIFCSIQAFN